MEVQAFDDSRGFAEALARELGVRCGQVEVHRFPDGESRVRVESDAETKVVLVRSLNQPNPKLVELLFAADAFRRGGVTELTLVVPYLGYMRQDRAFRAGEAVSQRVVGKLLGEAFDRVLTVEAHLHRTSRLADVIPCDAESISAAPQIGVWSRAEGRFDLVVGPDSESAPWVRVVAETANLPWIVCDKVRGGDRDVEVSVPIPPDGVRSALIVDDIASSGATLAAAARGLRRAGLERVEAVVSHALLGEKTERLLREAGITRLCSTDTIPHASNAISVASCVADRLREATFLPGDP